MKSLEIGQVTFTRRSLARHIGGALVCAGLTPGVLARVLTEPTPVVSFFLDQPYLDLSGLDKPYRPPAGMRGGQALATLSEEDFRNIAPHW